MDQKIEDELGELLDAISRGCRDEGLSKLYGRAKSIVVGEYDEGHLDNFESWIELLAKVQVPAIARIAHPLGAVTMSGHAAKRGDLKAAKHFAARARELTAELLEALPYLKAMEDAYKELQGRTGGEARSAKYSEPRLRRAVQLLDENGRSATPEVFTSKDQVFDFIEHRFPSEITSPEILKDAGNLRRSLERALSKSLALRLEFTALTCVSF